MLELRAEKEVGLGNLILSYYLFDPTGALI